MHIGIIGAGQIVEDAHLPTLCARNDLTVAWVADAEAAKAKRLGQMFSIPAVEAETALDRLADVDMCLIAIPYGAREAYLSACAEHGLPTYVEKPLAREAIEHEALVRRFPEHRLAVGFQRRFYRSMVSLRHLLKSGVFGGPRSAAVCLQNYSLKSGGGRYITNSAIAGGGVVIEVGIHLLDLLVSLVCPARLRTLRVNALIEKGIDYHVESSHELDTPFGVIPVECRFSLLTRGDNSLSVDFETCSVSIGLAPDDEVTVWSRNRRHVFDVRCLRAPSRYLARTPHEAFACAWDSFLTGATTGSDHELSAWRSLKTTEWVQAIYEGANCA